MRDAGPARYLGASDSRRRAGAIGTALRLRHKPFSLLKRADSGRYRPMQRPGCSIPHLRNAELPAKLGRGTVALVQFGAQATFPSGRIVCKTRMSTAPVSLPSKGGHARSKCFVLQKSEHVLLDLACRRA